MALQNLPKHLHSFSQTLDTSPLYHLGRRYSSDGVFLPEPGNTVVCHIVKDSMSAEAVIDARRRMQSLPESEKLAYTAVSSLHMTLFQGIIEYRRHLPYWPETITLDTPIDDMTTLFKRRLHDFESPGPFQLEVVGATPNGLEVAGISSQDRAVMKCWRDRFADIFGYRHPDHESYSFHITFAYVLDRFSDDAIEIWQKGLAEIVENLQECAPVIELEPPAFCSFNDMNHFEKLQVFE
jgi:hypothetical protein